MAKGHDAVAKRLAEVSAEFEESLEGEDMTSARRAKLRRAAELTVLAEVTRSNALLGSATVASVVSIEEIAQEARGALGVVEIATRDDLEAIIAKDGPTIIRALVGLAKGGDTAALRMVADRLLPVRERVLELSDFPEIREVKDLPIAAAYITRCVAQGRVYAI